MRTPRPSYFAWLDQRRSLAPRDVVFGTLSPKSGDVILRDSPDGRVVLIDAITDQHIAGPVQRSRAVQLARAHGAIGLWQQVVDDRGRPLGPPARLVID
jgi:hypothetical protein